MSSPSFYVLCAPSIGAISKCRVRGWGFSYLEDMDSLFLICCRDTLKHSCD